VYAKESVHDAISRLRFLSTSAHVAVLIQQCLPPLLIVAPCSTSAGVLATYRGIVMQPQYAQNSQLQLQQSQQQRSKRRCAEFCVDLLNTEAVKFFSERQYGPAAPAALEAIGYRLGRQLAERLVAACKQWDPCMHHCSRWCSTTIMLVTSSITCTTTQTI